MCNTCNTMNDEIISLRINKNLKEKMRMLNHLNWSVILRKMIEQQIEKIEEDNFDIDRAKKTSEDMNRIRKAGIFNKGRTGTEIIKDWRDKRKF